MNKNKYIFVEFYIVFLFYDFSVCWRIKKGLTLFSQPHKGHLAFKLKYRWFPSYLLCTLLLFTFHLLPSPMHPTGFSFCFFPGFLAVFTLLSSNNKAGQSHSTWWQEIYTRWFPDKIPPKKKNLAAFFCSYVVSVCNSLRSR